MAARVAVFSSTMGREGWGSVLECLALRNDAWPRSWVLGILESLECTRSQTNEAHCLPRDDALKTKEYPDSA